MLRVSQAELRSLFPQDSGERSLLGYLQDANMLVNETLGTNSGLTDERLAMIEKYLAAHLYTLAELEGGVFEEKIGESSTKHGSTFTLGQGMRLTRFGQMVLGLDTTGAFEALEGGKKKAQFRVL